MYTMEDARIDAMSEPDYDEEDLELSKEEFCEKYDCTGEEYDMIIKRYQEM